MRESLIFIAMLLSEQVKNNLNKLSISNVRLVKGAVEDTLKVEENIPERISLLRLDTDWYESTTK